MRFNIFYLISLSHLILVTISGFETLLTLTFHMSIAGRVRNIYFPFDIESDTAYSVANEMVFELDITNQDVHKIADMIDGEISCLVPGWKKGRSEDHENKDGICQTCASTISHINPKSKNPLQCSRHHCGANIHGRFEEITYQFDGSEQCLTDGAPVVSSQSDGLQYSDIWGAHPSEYHSCTEDEPVVEKTVKFEEPDIAADDDYENEIRQELRWLKAKYQMELRELKDKQLGLAPKYDKHKASRQHKDHDHLLKTFASGTHFVSFSLDDEETETTKNLCSGDLISEPLHRATSLPVDPIDS